MSCCNCLSIRVGTSDYLNLPPDFSIEEFKRREELTILGQVGGVDVLEASIPATENNRRIAGALLEPGTISPNYRPTSCLVLENGQRKPFSLIQFVGNEDQSDTLTIRITQGDSHWKEKASVRRLNEIDQLGSYPFTVGYVTNNQTNDAEYSDGDDGIYFPLVNFGKFFRGEDTTINIDVDFFNLDVEESNAARLIIEDFRPHFHVLSILQKSLCSIGWNFRCPVLETSTGRRLGAYLLPESLGQNPEDLEAAKFEANIPFGPTYDDEILIDNEVFDNNNNFDSGRFTTPGVHDFHVEFLAGRNTFGEFYLYLLVVDSTGVINNIVTQIKEDSPFVDIKETFSGVTVLPGQHVKVIITNGGALMYIARAKFSNTPRRLLPVRGETIQIRDIIANYSILQVLEGVEHFLEGRTVTDYNTRTLWLYTPRDVEFYGDSAEGFRKSTLDDWTDIVVPNSRSISYEKVDQKRFIRYAWDDSSDPSIKELGLPEGVSYLEKLVDLGEEYEGGNADERKNPFFQPTRNKQLDITFPNYLTDGLTDMSPDCPHMLDNDDGELSFDIGPRLVYFAGPVKQKNSDESKTSFFRLENFSSQDVPYAYMVPGPGILVNGSVPPVRVAYGDYEGIDFYSLFIRNELLSGLLTSGHSLLVNLDQARFSNEDFRESKKIFYRGRTYVADLIELSGRQSCSDGPVQSVVQPLAFVGDYCGDEIFSDGCNNQPRINVDIDFEAGSITATANDDGITSPIDTDTWESSVDGGSNYSAYTPGTAVTGESEVIFRRTVTFSDGCSDKTVSRLADFTGLCANSPGITVNYDATGDELVATKSGTFNSPIDSDEMFVSVDGGAEVSYTEETPISSFTTAVFRRVVTFTNACPDVEVTSSFDITEQPCVNSPQITFSEVATGVYMIQISGSTSSSIAYSDIQISHDNGVTWKVWDRSPVVPSGTFKVRAIIHYSDSCPQQIIEAECPS